MNLCAESNGISATRRIGVSSPALWASARSAPSVGSPTTRQCPSTSVSRASLHSAIT